MKVIPEKVLALFLTDQRTGLIVNYFLSLWLIAFFCKAVPSLTGINICLSKKLLNIECPGCGITTGINHFFNMNFKSAAECNPSSLVIGLLLASNAIIALSAVFHQKISHCQLLKLSIYSDSIITISILISFIFFIIKKIQLWH